MFKITCFSKSSPSIERKEEWRRDLIHTYSIQWILTTTLCQKNHELIVFDEKVFFPPYRAVELVNVESRTEIRVGIQRWLLLHSIKWQCSSQETIKNFSCVFQRSCWRNHFLEKNGSMMISWSSEAKHLTDELKEVKYRQGDKHSSLGMQFSFNSDDHLKISMEGYIDNILTVWMEWQWSEKDSSCCRSAHPPEQGLNLHWSNCLATRVNKFTTKQPFTSSCSFVSTHWMELKLSVM